VEPVPRSPATARDVADLAATSTAVVSYVVNDGPRPVSAVTRQRVLAAIAELGYRPNRIARAMRSASSGTIGVLVPDIRVPYFGALVAAIEERAFADGRLALVGSTHFDAARERAHALALADARVDALIVASGAPADLGDLDVPVVYVHQGPVPSRPAQIGIDDRLAGRMAAEHLLSTDPDHVVVLAPRSPVGPVRARLAGVAATLRRAGRGAGATTLRCPYDRAATRDILAASLDGFPRRIGIVAITDEHAIGALAAVHASGRCVPDDVAIVSIDGTRETATTSPPLSAVTVPIGALADRAVDAALGVAVDPEPLPLVLVVRDST
jgi:LacI family transcriptional regulator